MTLSEIIKEMQGRQPAVVVAAHTSTELALAHVCLAIGELEQRIAALETGQPTVERRKPGRPRKNLEANPG